MNHYCFTCWIAALLLGAVMILSGCSEGNHGTVPVQITVTYKGAPADEAIVTLVAKDGKVASGVCNANGVATVKTSEGWNGAMPGEYSVSIVKMKTTFEPAAPTKEDPERTSIAKTEYLLPKKYGSPSSSGLKATIAADTKTLSFDLTD